MEMSFDHIADLYDETRELPSEVLRRFYAFIDEQVGLRSNLTVLDAGIGTGRTVDPLLDCGAKLIGLDISSSMLRKMAEKFRESDKMKQVSLIVGDVTKLPLRTSSFDLVLSIQVLHLVENWREAIQDTIRILKPQGVFVVANAGSPYIESKVGQKYDELSQKYEASGLPKRIVRRIYRNLRPRVLRRFAKSVFDYSGLAVSFDYERADRSLKEYGGLVRKETISWRQTFEIPVILDGLDKKILSRQWKIPTETHEKIMFELKKWIHEKIGTTHSSEEMERKFKIVMARFR